MIDSNNNQTLQQTTFAPANKSIVVDILQSLIIAIFISVVIYIFIATPNQISGDSMLPNFHDGELVLTNKISQWLGGSDLGIQLGLNYQRGDVVVLHKPGFAKPFIKRIIAMPGDRIRLEEGSIYINDTLLREDYIPTEVRTISGTFLTDGEEKTIPSEQYVVLGDNRKNSEDSRYIEVGFIKREWLQGKVIFRYWPPTAFGIISTGSFNLDE